MYFRCGWTKSLIDSMELLPYMMTICVYGKDIAKHNNLLQLTKTAQVQGLAFKSSKCAIRQSQISFYGAIIMVQGMRPNPAKVQALQDLPTPQNSKHLQSFLGLINYLLPFLPGLASKTTFIREQVTNWGWNPSTDQAFHCLKSWICNTSQDHPSLL